MISARIASLLLAGSLAVALSSCAESNDRTLSKVFVAPPWTGDERNEYDLIDEGGDLYGTCVLETDVDAEPGKTRLSRTAPTNRATAMGTVLDDRGRSFLWRQRASGRTRRRTSESQPSASTNHRS